MLRCVFSPRAWMMPARRGESPEVGGFCPATALQKRQGEGGLMIVASKQRLGVCAAGVSGVCRPLLVSSLTSGTQAPPPARTARGPAARGTARRAPARCTAQP